MQTFGVRVDDRLQEIEVGTLDRRDPADLAAHMHRRRLEADLRAVVLAEARDIFAVMRLDALEPLEEIDMEIGAAELAVGDALEADVLLRAHDLADALVLDRVQFVRRKAAGGEFAPAPPSGARGAGSCRHGRRGTADGAWAPPWSGRKSRAIDRVTPRAPLATRSRARGSAPRGEKGSQHRRRLALADAAVDFRRMMAGRLAERSAAHGRRRRPSDRARRNRDGGCARARSRRRTSRRARASRRGRSRRGARSRSPRPPRGWRSVRRAPSGRRSSRVRLPARAIMAPSRTITAPIGASPRASAARASAKARLIGSFAASSAFDKRRS